MTLRGRVRGRCGGNLVAQDRRLERAQIRRRLDAQAVDQRLVSAAVGLERLGLTSGTVEGEHLLAAEALAERVLADERLELAGHLGVAAAGEVRVDAVADARQAKILQPRDLRLCEPGVGHVGEGRPAPQLQRASQRRRRLPGLAGAELRPAVADKPLELVGVELARRQPQRISASLRAKDALAERAAKPRGHDVDRLPAPCRAGTLPELVEGSIDGHDGAARKQQQSEQRERPAAGYVPARVRRGGDLYGTEDPELGFHVGPRLVLPGPGVKPFRNRAVRRCTRCSKRPPSSASSPGLVGVADTVPYVRDTVRGRTRPHRGTWLIWGVLAIVACVSQRADGASWSLVLWPARPCSPAWSSLWRSATARAA